MSDVQDATEPAANVAEACSRFFPSPSHEEAFARLMFLVEQSRRFGWLSGEAGTGKSLLLQLFREEARRMQRRAVLIDLVGRSTNDLLWELGVQLGQSPHPDVTTQRLWRTVEEGLDALQQTRHPVVLVFDHFDRADHDTVTCVERLLHHGNWDASPLTFCLAVRHKQPRGRGAALSEIADLHVELPALDLPQIDAYVTHVLDCLKHPVSFERSIIELLHQATQGHMRELRRVLEMSLLAAEACELDELTDSLVLGAAEELGLLTGNSSARF